MAQDLDFQKLKQNISHALDGDGRMGLYFGLWLMGLIIISVVLMLLGSMENMRNSYGVYIVFGDILIGLLFLIEYLLRIWTAQNRLRYIFSFWGAIDLLASLPALWILGPGTASLRSFRLFRLLIIFKYFKLFGALERLSAAFGAVKKELLVFMFIACLLLLFGAAGIYHFENEAQPEVFSSIPASLWWAVITLTTVGYGDAYPITTGGRAFTGIFLLVGLGVIAVPTGIFSAALVNMPRGEEDENQEEK